MEDSAFITSDCILCEKPITLPEAEIACNLCNSKFHKDCVKNDNMQTWCCPSCSKQGSLTVNPPGAPRSSKSRVISKGKSSTSSKAKAILKVLEAEKKLLEEQAKEKEKLLKETHDQQLQNLKKRQELIEELVSSKSGSSHSIVSAQSMTSKEKVEAWIEKQKSTPQREIAVQTDFEPKVEERVVNFHSSTQRHVTEPPLPPMLKENATNIYSSTQFPKPLVNSTFLVDNQSKLQHFTTDTSTTKHNLTKEEVAARHVVKELPKFDGSPMKWPKFYASFNRTTTVCGFNNYENLERLNQSLCGDAFKAVESSLSLEENVPRIIETLEMLFGKPEFIINSLIEEMKKSPLPSSDSIDSIIRYSLEIENISATMKVAKLAEHLWNPILLGDMIERLPINLKMEWATYKYSNPNSNIEVFAMWLKQKAMTYSTILVRPPNISASERSLKGKNSVHVHQEHNIIKCIVCSGNCKQIQNCRKFKDLSLNDKWEIIKKNQICRICLTKHKDRMCSKDNICGIDGCQFRHHHLLHKSKSVVVPENSKQDEKAVNLHVTTDQTYFKILPVYLRNGKKTMRVFAMLDDGSSITLIDEGVAKSLGLRGDNHPLCVRWTNGVERTDNNSEKVSLKISQFSDSQELTLSNVHTSDNLRLPVQSVDIEKLGNSYNHLKGIPMESYENAQPVLLIGLKHSKFMAIKKYRFGNDNEPFAAKTTLGWCIFGSCSQTNRHDVFHINHCDCNFELDKKLEELVTRNYALDAVGVSSPTATPRSSDDIKAIRILESTTKLKRNRYEVGLLWRYDQVNLPNNIKLAKRRHECLEKRFATEPDLYLVINEQIQEYVKKGYARKVDKGELESSSSWFLPIFVVTNPNKPNKVRMVWDAAAEMNGVSLNKMLLKGPDLLVSLPGVLLRFREHKVALTGDIKEMFHQIAIRKEDRRFQRFVWRTCPDSEYEIYEMNVMTFGASCSPCCSQHIKNVNAEKFRDDFESAVNAIQKNHYVDDWLESFDTIDQAIRMAEEVREIHSQGGFTIRNWISNEPAVVQHLNESPTIEMKNLEIGSDENAEKILGMFWKTSGDVFTYILRVRESNADIFSGQKVPTKRQFLKILMSLFDPLGLISIVMIYPKILLQRIWRLKTGWDQEISEDHHKQWLSWAKSLTNLQDIEITRWLGLKVAGSEVELHCFVDASEDAFGAVVYFKVKCENEDKCSLVTSKSRVAPLQGLSVPRLELQAAVLGSRLVKFVHENISHQHTITRRYFWTDSETVMKWLLSDTRKYTQYVGCRIGEILENSMVSEWNWISGTNNIADKVTKMRIHSIHNHKEWFHGPSFLFDDNYPVRKLTLKDTSEELRPQHQNHHVNYHEDVEYRVEKWRKLRRIFAYVLRFIKNLKRARQGITIKGGSLTAEEYFDADIALIKKAQQEAYREEYLILLNGGLVKNRRSDIFKDSPFLDHFGVIRSKSRIQSSTDVTFETKNPVLLPKYHRITSMILQFYHDRYHHQYINTVCNEVKQKYIVPRLKVELNKLRKQCQFCKNRDAKPDIPEESELPPSRLTSFTRPFTFVGVDYFGPIYVAVGRKRDKRWCMLVTCLTTRAVHLEVSHSLSTDSCILALRRFMSRRGKPREIYSDNGTNFRGAKRELREIWENIDKNRLAETFVDSETKWMFIPPASPHMGGAWERMVRSVKNSLKAALPTRTPTDELLLTYLAEVENIVNNRPLTYVSLDNGSDEALTPNHLLLGSSSGVKPLGKFNDESSTLRANWHKSQLFAKIFWKRWVKEYLPTLSRRTKWFLPSSKEIQKNDIVIVLCEENPGSWPKARVLETYPGRDGQIRSARIQTAYGIYTRPVSKLAVLDVCAREDGILDSSRIPGGSVDSITNSQ